MDFSCADTGGSGLASCVGSVADGTLLDTSQLGPVSVTVTARDNAGNETVVTNTVTVEDQTKPTITLTTPAEGAVYELGSTCMAEYSCADEPNGSGLDSCEGTVANGAAVDTASLGQKTFTVNASDEAGNTRVQERELPVVDANAARDHRHDPGRRGGLRGGRAVAAELLLHGSRTPAWTAAWAAWPVGAAVDTASVGEKTLHRPGQRQGRQHRLQDRELPRGGHERPGHHAHEAGRGRACTRSASGCSPSYSCADEPNGSGLATCQGSVANGAALDTASVGRRRSR